MSRSTWNQIANGTTARALATQTRSDVLEMIRTAEEHTADAHCGTAEDFDAAAPIVARNLRGAADARALLNSSDLLRLAFAVRSARATFGHYINLPEDPTQ